MKNVVSILVAFFIMINASFATIRTVSNSPFGGAQYNLLQAAYDASANGDTILLEGTDVPYHLGSWVYWNKNLVTIGMGYNPNKQNPKRAKIREEGAYEFRLAASADGNRFYGIEFTSNVTLDGAVDNFLFEGCKFNVRFDFFCHSSSGFIFRNCIFDADNSMNFVIGGCELVFSGLITNCVFDGYIEGSNTPNVSLIIDHSLFLRPANPFNNLRYAQIQNCIFLNAFPNGTFNSEFTNNIAAVAGTFPPQPANGNTGTGNIENTNPLLVSYSGTYYSPAHDYDVQAGSAAINAGSDGTDIGVHGGTSNFSETGEVLITPIMRSMSILNSSVPSNGTLNVQVHASKPSTD